MLLQFGVSNHLSIRDRQELSLATSALKDKTHGLISCSATPTGTVVPAAVIYGANASGKTNLINAMWDMRSMVLWSHARGEPGGGMPHSPFKLDPDCNDKPSCFDIDFVIEDVRHHYGFETSDKEVLSEWLFVFPKGYRRTLFERNRNDYYFGRHLGGPNRTIKGLTRPNSLFVSAAAQNDHETLSRVAAYFRSMNGIQIIDINGVALSSHLVKRDEDDRIIEFLKKVGTGIVSQRRKGVKITEEHREIRQEIMELFLKRLPPGQLNLDDDADDTTHTVEFAHQGIDGQSVYFDLDRESAGTRRLSLLLDRAYGALDKGTPLLIDELDASLHTHAAEAVLGLFGSSKTNPKGAQLIATTHDTNLMKSPSLRRDQLWFTEKSGIGSTILYPLTDISTRQGDNFERSYLQGRYGGVPSAAWILNRGA